MTASLLSNGAFEKLFSLTIPVGRIQMSSQMVGSDEWVMANYRYFIDFIGRSGHAVISQERERKLKDYELVWCLVGRGKFVWCSGPLRVRFLVINLNIIFVLWVGRRLESYVEEIMPMEGSRQKVHDPRGVYAFTSSPSASIAGIRDSPYAHTPQIQLYEDYSLQVRTTGRRTGLT